MTLVSAPAYCRALGRRGDYNVVGFCNQYLRCESFNFGLAPFFSAIRFTCPIGTAFNGLLRSAVQPPCIQDPACNVVFGECAQPLVNRTRE